MVFILGPQIVAVCIVHRDVSFDANLLNESGDIFYKNIVTSFLRLKGFCCQKKVCLNYTSSINFVTASIVN
jgi:hypothetical protein